MATPLWTDARIHTQAITYSGYISSVVKALTEMRDEYEAALTVANERIADLEHNHAGWQASLDDRDAVIARLMAKLEIQY